MHSRYAMTRCRINAFRGPISIGTAQTRLSLYWNKSDEILTADALILEHSANGLGKQCSDAQLFHF